MLKRNLIPLLILLFINNCGFTPIYNTSEKMDYNIVLIEKEGDNIINNKIISEITRLAKKDSNKIFNIKLTTNYSKSIISKDAKGSATNYEISVSAIFNIEYENTSKEIVINEKQKIKKITDIFEQRNYENTLKNNFALSIVNKLNIELLSIK
tara:strand:+ start:1282 stop:1740 length:459 start_codon:yes stop_codon:yes gene_type:complete